MHTPGPWKACTPRFGYQTVRQDPKDWDGHGYQAICTVPQSNKGTHYGEMFRANARLIAAAPDLLEALEAINRVASPDAFRTADKAMYALELITDRARAAIAKATEDSSTDCKQASNK